MTWPKLSLKGGLKEGLVQTLNVAKYIFVSMAVVGLGLYIADQSVSWAALSDAMLLAGSNLVLVFLNEWLTTAELPK